MILSLTLQLPGRPSPAPPRITRCCRASIAGVASGVTGTGIGFFERVIVPAATGAQLGHWLTGRHAYLVPFL
jgi:hypothetical protein